MPWRKLKYWIPNPDRRKYHKLRETQSETPQYLTPSMTFPLQTNQSTSCRQGEAMASSTVQWRTATRITLQATNKATTATTTTLTTSAKTGAHNRTGSTDAGSRDTDTSPDGLSMTLSSSTTQETRTWWATLEEQSTTWRKVHRTGKQPEGYLNSSTGPSTKLVKIALPQYPLQRFRPSWTRISTSSLMH